MGAGIVKEAKMLQLFLLLVDSFFSPWPPQMGLAESSAAPGTTGIVLYCAVCLCFILVPVFDRGRYGIYSWTSFDDDDDDDDDE